MDYDNDIASEFIVVYTHAEEQHRILVPPVVERGTINEQSTKNAIAAAIRRRHALRLALPQEYLLLLEAQATHR